jgi:hypothetical protein
MRLWTDCRKQYGGAGKWLFVEAVCNLESVQRWIEAAKAESEFLPFIDDLVPAKDSPLTPG